MISGMSVRSISLSGFAASARSSFFCFLERFFIECPFARRGFSGGNNGNRFFAVLFVPGVGNEKDKHSSYGAYRLPSFFAFDDALQTTLCLRIVKYESRRFEGNAVLGRIAAVLSLVPCYAHQRYFETVVTLSKLRVGLSSRSLFSSGGGDAWAKF